MTTPRNRNDADLMLMIGQLVEGAKAASEGIRSLGSEVRANATAVITAMHTVTTLQDSLAQLDRIVRDAENPHHLMGVVGTHGLDLATLKHAVSDMRTTIEKMQTAVNQLNAGQYESTGMRTTLWYLIVGVGWALTTGVAIYAAVK